jgi:hypothetical protein
MKSHNREQKLTLLYLIGIVVMLFCLFCGKIMNAQNVTIIQPLPTFRVIDINKPEKTETNITIINVQQPNSINCTKKLPNNIPAIQPVIQPIIRQTVTFSPVQPIKIID